MRVSFYEIVYPQSAANSHGMFSRYFTVTMITAASAHHGRRARTNTLQYNFFNATGSKSSPARVNITTSAIFLEHKKNKSKRHFVFGYKIVYTN